MIPLSSRMPSMNWNRYFYWVLTTDRAETFKDTEGRIYRIREAVSHLLGYNDIWNDLRKWETGRNIQEILDLPDSPYVIKSLTYFVFDKAFCNTTRASLLIPL